MKNFETITEYEILEMAWIELITRYAKEEERNEQFKKEYGRPDQICEYRLKKIDEQANEIHSRMIEIQ